jgi:hypothetical protein
MHKRRLENTRGLRERGVRRGRAPLVSGAPPHPLSLPAENIRGCFSYTLLGIMMYNERNKH